ncbi:MAG: Ig-like domain-containing protein [Dysgonamonadaceae bacterium]|jgi:hypothetical protein|nr:Ig-like domain-containing protein [Dysgonamonadaceae bacterium]MDD3309368.1 Ig-like domain-containing protein [Dysgonamonadaceae bacterium]MDD3900373.1 Ig-like domain-containing protein [Dysgonamonadaceae bacterium]MDD4399009.1 Ig-like domain-containing protein [Dysgonamonadaceae bacterium]MEA5081664.1 Ig-like domain-containing protein [Dysgonamonadaceae bacterium]
MKTKFLKYSLVLLLLIGFIGCNDYVRTEVEKNIYVNHTSLNPFVGEQIQLMASPTDGTYKYTWLSEHPEVATVDINGLVNVIAEGFTNIIVKGGDIETKVPLTAVKRIPVTDVVLSETAIESFVNAKKTILVNYIPQQANDIPEYTWYSENEHIATVNEIGKITLVGEGSTNIVYKIGDIVKKVSIYSALTLPFKGPHTLSAATPCEIPAANFDFGGEGNAFHDQDTNNRSNNNYRRDNGDSNGSAVEVEGNGTNVGYTNKDEWLIFTIDVVDPGEYIVDISLSANGNNAAFHIQLDGVNVTPGGSVKVPNNSSWGNWRWFPNSGLSINFPVGKHRVKYYFDGGDHNLRALRFTKK